MKDHLVLFFPFYSNGSQNQYAHHWDYMIFFLGVPPFLVCSEKHRQLMYVYILRQLSWGDRSLSMISCTICEAFILLKAQSCLYFLHILVYWLF